MGTFFILYKKSNFSGETASATIFWSIDAFKPWKLQSSSRWHQPLKNLTFQYLRETSIVLRAICHCKFSLAMELWPPQRVTIIPRGTPKATAFMTMKVWKWRKNPYLVATRPYGIVVLLFSGKKVKVIFVFTLLLRHFYGIHSGIAVNEAGPHPV